VCDNGPISCVTKPRLGLQSTKNSIKPIDRHFILDPSLLSDEVNVVRMSGQIYIICISRDVFFRFLLRESYINLRLNLK